MPNESDLSDDFSTRVAEVMAIDPDAPGLCYEGKWYSWGGLSKLGDSSIFQLDELGIGSNEKVAIFLRNRPSIVATVLAFVRKRRSFICLNPLLPPESLSDDIRETSPRAIVVDDEGMSEKRIDAIAQISCSVVTPTMNWARSTVRSASLFETLGSSSDREATIDILTSGTTGPAKRVHVSLRRMALAAAAADIHHGNVSDFPQLRTGPAIIDLPLYHVAAMGGLLSAVANGRCVILFDRFDPHSWATAVHENKLRVASLVPAAMRMVLDADISRQKLASLKVVRAGTAHLDLDTQAEFEGRYSVTVIRAYGATEFAGGVASMTLADRIAFGESKSGSVGRPHPGVSVRVVETDGGRILPPNELGVLMLKSEQLDETDDDGWILTSDLARVDDDGFLWIEGRVDDVLIRGGFKISALEVEDTLRKHPRVRDASVLPLPDRRLGQIPVAAVEVIADGGPVPSEKELQMWVRDRLSPYKVPARVLIVDSLPYTETHKVKRDDLLALFTNEYQSS